MKHWTKTDFEHWLYDLKDKDAHLDECPECRGEIERLALKRKQIIAEPTVSNDLLAAQRRNIYRRLEERPRTWVAMRWALSAAMLMVMVLGFTLQRLNKPAQTISDEQLFSDLAAMDQSAEPKAIQPMHKLFEE